ncbi:hypothetical protein VCHA37P203_80006 [Vibrio chagasii]|nr:hypothetical protein VCHA36P168_70245 [Vibrio chagasii]CAH7470378.1 hypothetical protein VCHA37P203_80006 [Vibrio chagasii]CAH7475896.1 hypothetical protein VCHA57P527_70006 [Vibrio chagasii]
MMDIYPIVLCDIEHTIRSIRLASSEFDKQKPHNFTYAAFVFLVFPVVFQVMTN